VIIEVLLVPLLKPLDKIRRWLFPLLGKFFHSTFPWILNCLCVLKIARWINEPDENTVWRARCLWEEAKKRGIKMRAWRIFNLPNDTFLAEYKNDFVFFQGLPRPHGSEPESLDWMDNKGEMNKRFLPLDIPIAKGGAVTSWRQTLKWFQELSKPVIIKPNWGSRSRHTTIHINTTSELRVAFLKAKQLCPWIVIEEELAGSVYRGTVIAGKVAGVLRRDPACVWGDGVKTIKQLVVEENQHPLRQGPLFHHLPMTEEAEKELAQQNLTWESVPKINQQVVLNTKTSRGVGGALIDCTSETHPDNILLLEKIAQVLKNPIVGVDFIISDINKSWREQVKCGVIECNSLPFIDLHHYPLRGTPRNVAGELWSLVFTD
jgi:D-alanine-D-alanine ligase-like ATP-grasp enzyme